MIKINKKLNILAFSLVLGIIFLPAAKSFASDITASNIIKLVNEVRNIQGLEPLSENFILNKIAADKLQDMVENKYFAHTSPQGKTPWYWFGKNKYDYEYAGENLAIDFMTAEKQHAAWMKSETHKKNILSPNFTEIGVAVGTGEIDDHISIITVQVFGNPAQSGVPANKQENFTSAQKGFAFEKGTVLSAKEMKLEKSSDVNNYPSQESPIKKWSSNFENNNDGRLFDYGWTASWLILILALVANSLVILMAIFRVKFRANRLANRVKVRVADGNFIRLKAI